MLHAKDGLDNLLLENFLNGHLFLHVLLNELGCRKEELRLGDFQVLAFSELSKRSLRVDFCESVGSAIYHEHC